MTVKYDLTELRGSDVVSTFGPGSVIDFLADGAPISGIAAGLEEWDHSFGPAGMGNPQIIRETRLQKRLRVKGFRAPPTILSRNHPSKTDRRRLVVTRFPKWLQCPQCHILKPDRKWGKEPGKVYRYCKKCTEKNGGNNKIFVIPVRFVMACTRGHVDEFPWDNWLQHEQNCNRAKYEDFESHPGLKLELRKPGLEGLILSCEACGKKRSMSGVFSYSQNCRGLRPWIAEGKEECDHKQTVVQRGASNLYFPCIESALSIPPWSDNLQESLGTFWSSLVNYKDHPNLEQHIEFLAEGDLKGIIEELNLTPARLAKEVRRRLKSYAKVNAESLLPQEYKQFVYDSSSERKFKNDFETRREKVPKKLKLWISQVIRVVRLREVRALRGFTRINPANDPSTTSVAELSRERLEWLPGIEIRGEGIFLELNLDLVKEWECRRNVIERVQSCKNQFNSLFSKLSQSSNQKGPTPRYMLCHTLAHSLMRQLTLECGYSAAALQERIYAGTDDIDMAGLLIYTATTDADGTLGGLERQGRTERFQKIFLKAIKALEWCSSDPLCITDSMNASDSFSRSVCHACCLAPETSCESFNRFLDRGLLVGDGTFHGTGYFESLLMSKSNGFRDNPRTTPDAKNSRESK